MSTKRRLLLSLSVSLVVLALVVGVLMGSVQALLDRPIKRVEVSGQLKFASTQQIQQQLEFLLTQSFMSLDLPKVKAGLENQPWISSVSLTRRWPDQLFVLIEEQEPVVKWLNSGFINDRGQVIKLPKPQQALISHLPFINGRQKDAVDLLAFFRKVETLLMDRHWKLIGLSDVKNSGRVLSVVREPHSESERSGSQRVIQLDLFLPTLNAWPRLISVLEVLESSQFSSQLSDIGGVDLRYSDGFSVLWKSKL